MEPLAIAATLGPPELLLILMLVLLVFGGAKLPKLARSLGQAQREFKTGLSEGAGDSTATNASGGHADEPVGGN